MASTTLRAWVSGRPYRSGESVVRSRPLIRPPAVNPPVLSFWNLVEAHVLRALRTEHGVSLRAVRKALTYAEGSLGIERLLLRKELCTDAGRLFLERYGQLIDLSASGQIAMRHLFDEHLKRVVWDEWEFPVRLYPFLSGGIPASEGRPIAIDPKIAFGQPVLLRRGISTRAITERIDAGETVDELAADYELTSREIEEGVLYERSA